MLPSPKVRISVVDNVKFLVPFCVHSMQNVPKKTRKRFVTSVQSLIRSQSECVHWKIVKKKRVRFGIQ